MTTKTAIQKSIIINAPRAAVFKALTSEDALAHWFPNQAKLEPRVGGAAEFWFLRPDCDADNRVVGKVLEIIPDRKLSMSWKNASDPDFPDTTVTWTLEPVGDGRKTKVTLVHTGFEKDSRWFGLHDEGWAFFIRNLVEYCATGRIENRAAYKEKLNGEIRKTIVIDAPPKAVFKALTDKNELTSWFPDHADFEPKQVGSRFQFSFYKEGKQHDRIMDRDYFPEGKILKCIPDKKISYTWTHKDMPDFPESVVTWTLEPMDGSGSTKVTLLHSGFEKGSKWLDLHDEDWSYYAGKLVEHLQMKKKDTKA